MKKIFLSSLLVLSGLMLIGQTGSELLQSGPMPGYSTMKEVMIWVQTKSKARVYIKFKEKGIDGPFIKTESYMTVSEEAFVAKIIAFVDPGKTYTYELYINGAKMELPYLLEFQSQELWQWRHDPPNLSFALGSCNYVNETEVDRPGKPYGADHFIFESILEKQPEFMVWMGDNTYLREVDWNSMAGILHRNTHTRSLPELQPLLGSVHHYATWDDHDYGPNNSDRSYWMKEATLEAFKLFWANPSYGPGGGVSGTFFWGDIQFFMMDNRYFRTPNNLITEKKEMFGEQQLQWLIDALSVSQAPFKFIVTGGQVLNPVIASWTENFAKYPEEQKKLFDSIKENDIKGVFFLTGDRHMVELSKMDREGTYPFYDLTVSPFSAGPDNDRSVDEDNSYRVPGTYYGQRNFAILEVTGPRKSRSLNIKIYDSWGKEVWSKAIHEDELK